MWIAINPSVSVNINTQIYIYIFFLSWKGKQSYFLHLLRWYIYVQGNAFCLGKLQLMITEECLEGGNL